MIKSLTIKNFQSHKNSQLDFSDGINVITGSSNCGKTAIIRALNFVITNRPQGLAFKSSFADKKETCKVSLVINNQEIIREKNTSINQYQVGGSLFDTIGNDVPSEISSAINMSDINISTQFEKHFLLMDSPGEVGRTINKIVKLDNIDALISNITSKVNSINKELEIKKKDLDKLYLDLEKFKDFDSIEKLVNSIVDYSTKIQNYTNIVNSLNHIINNVSIADAEIEKIEKEYIGIEDRINNLEQNWAKYHANIKIVSDLEKLIKAINKEEEIIARSENNILYESDIDKFQEQLIKYISVKDVHYRLNYIIEEWEERTEKIKKIDKLIERDEKEFDNLLKEFGCPLCGKGF